MLFRSNAVNLGIFEWLLPVSAENTHDPPTDPDPEPPTDPECEPDTPPVAAAAAVPLTPPLHEGVKNQQRPEAA